MTRWLALLALLSVATYGLMPRCLCATPSAATCNCAASGGGTGPTGPTGATGPSGSPTLDCTSTVGQLHACTVHLSSAQILTLHTVPVPIIPDPGPNLIVFPLTAYGTFHAKTTPYTDNGAVGILWTNDIGASGTDDGIAFTGALLQEPADNIYYVSQSSPNKFIGGLLTIGNFSNVVHSGMVIINDPPDPTGGDGTLDVQVIYEVLPYTPPTTTTTTTSTTTSTTGP